MDTTRQLQGTLFKYGPAQTHIAFVTGNSDRHLVLVGGLGDGLLFAPYSVKLSDRLQEAGWSTVHVLLSSSGLSYGIGSLDTDADEINLLAAYLRQHFNSKGFVLMGHSTGSQDTVRYAAKYSKSGAAPPVLGYIMQAPVSDREAPRSTPDDLLAERMDAAQLMVSNGEGEEILFRDWEMRGAPISSRRFVALLAHDGDDDLFSSDFPDEKLKDKLGHMAGVPSLFIMGGADEFVPETVDKDTLVRRLAAAVGPSAAPVLVPGGKHNLTGSEPELLDIVVDFLARL